MFSKDSCALLTDLYQIKMAYGYWNNGHQDSKAVYHLYFRQAPFDQTFAIFCGLGSIIEFIQSFKFSKSDVEYLGSLKTPCNKPLFPTDFLSFLESMQLTCSIYAPPEGTLVLPKTPLLRVEGPIIECQLLESILLNFINFQTLIATKAARVALAAGSDKVLEFGLRRAQGVDGALSASRASYIGGCHATSNVLAGKLYGIPVAGTHSHSWVLSFDSEEESFEAFANTFPTDSSFLIDTYNTISGLDKAIKIAKRLRLQGREIAGIRLDSGDLAELSKACRDKLDRNGFPRVPIIASNDLDEYAIEQLKSSNSCISIWGVGTRLVTGHTQSALGGVYKLGALKRSRSDWESKMKVSNDSQKTTLPGIHQVKRYNWAKESRFDLIYDIRKPPTKSIRGYDSQHRKMANLSAEDAGVDLLQTIFKKGKLVYTEPKIHEIRNFVKEQLKTLNLENRKVCDNLICKTVIDHSIIEQSSDLITQSDFNLGV